MSGLSTYTDIPQVTNVKTRTKLLPLVALLLALAGCLNIPSHDEMVAAGKDACSDYGFTPDTDQYRQCVQKEALTTKSHIHAALAAAAREPEWLLKSPRRYPRD
jgi:hypothetical protein